MACSQVELVAWRNLCIPELVDTPPLVGGLLTQHWELGTQHSSLTPEERAQILAQRLRELGVDPDSPRKLG
ncbi:hypothetical protein [Nostoc sp.]|uniref:hypothetical protein n=1 Tax=Nostoc sp. TaxID=1180 RepID=UPI002FF89268